jgi:radical SAM superfamily enzyme YgiQ (UPF0313 family)
MARGILVSFAGFPLTACSLFPDNGLAVLAGALLANGHEVKVLDFNTIGTLRRWSSPERTRELASILPDLSHGIDEALAERIFAIDAAVEPDLLRIADLLAADIASEIERQRSDFVGFKLWSGDGFTASVRIAEELRRRFPQLKLFGGGPAVLYSGAVVLELTTVFDALVDGEGEEAIVGLARYAEGALDLASVPNLIVRHYGTISRTRRSRIADPFTFARPVYDPEIYPSLATDEQIKVFVLEESRGCPNGCAFCVHENASGDRWRTSDPRVFVEMASGIFEKFGVSTFRFGGSNTPPQLLDDISAIMISEGLRARFSGMLHATSVQHADIDRLARAGCISVFVGVESFHEPDLVKIGKRVTAQASRDAVLRCQGAGLVPGVSLIVPSPGSTPESLAVNRAAALELCSRSRASLMVSVPALIPGTRWWNDRSAYGFDLKVSEDEYLAGLVTYKIRLTVPPLLWEPLRYTLDGRSFTACAAESARFQQDLAGEGVVLNVGIEAMLMADALGVSLHSIKDTLFRLFFTLDCDGIQRFANSINAALRAS